MLRLVILLLSFVLRCYAQVVCDEVEVSQTEQACLVNFTTSVMKAYMSLADSMGDSEDSSDTSNEAAAINAMRGAFGELCSNEVCLNGIKKAYTACKAQNQALYKFDMIAVIELFCYKTSNGKFCVNELPELQGSAPSTCSSVLKDQKCSDACKMELKNISSTCCFSSAVELLYSEAPIKDEYSKISQSCGITIPKLCDLQSGSYPGDDDGGSNGASDAAIFGYIMIILLLSVIVLCLMVFVVKVKCKNRVPFDENYTKVPFDIEEDSDAI